MEKKKIGRPSSNPRLDTLSIRLSKTEIEMLKECTEKLKTTRTEIIAKGKKKYLRK